MQLLGSQEIFCSILGLDNQTTIPKLSLLCHCYTKILEIEYEGLSNRFKKKGRDSDCRDNASIIAIRLILSFACRNLSRSFAYHSSSSATATAKVAVSFQKRIIPLCRSIKKRATYQYANSHEQSDY